MLFLQWRPIFLKVCTDRDFKSAWQGFTNAQICSKSIRRWSRLSARDKQTSAIYESGWRAALQRWGSVNKLIYFGNLSLPLSLFLPSLSKWMTTIWLRIWDVQAALTGELSGAQRSLLSAENSSEVRVQEPSLLSLSVSRTSSAARASWQVISNHNNYSDYWCHKHSPKAEQ